MRRFTDFENHPIDLISEMANMLHELQTELDNGNISYDEFRELASDILDYGQIDEYANSVDQKAFMKETIDALQFIVDRLPMT